MANTTVPVNTSLDPTAPDIAVDRISGVDLQRIKAGWGPEGTYHDTADVDGERLPVGGLQIGTLTETAPASDTASSGLNGRLQRIAQRLTSLITLIGGGLPAALTGAGGLKTGAVEGSATLTVASGGNLSTQIDMAGMRNMGLFVPSAFDGSQISFFAAPTSGGLDYQVYDINNNPVLMTVAANRYYDLPGELMGIRFLKINTTTAQAGTDTIFTIVSRS